MWNSDDDGAEDDDDEFEDDEDAAAAVSVDDDVVGIDDVDLLLPLLSKANNCDVTGGCCSLRG